MKLFALFAVLTVGCGSPLPEGEVEAIRSELIVTSPFGFNVSQQVWVGQDLTTGHSTAGRSGVLFIRYSDGLCSWLSLDNGSGAIGQNTDIYGSYLGDFMAHIASTTTLTCPNGIQYRLGRVTVTSSGVRVNLFGLAGNDAVLCNGSSIAGYGINTCNGDDGDDVLTASDDRNVVRGGLGNDAIRMVTNGVSAKAFGDEGNDCITRTPSYQGTIDCSAGADKVNNTVLGTVGCETLSTNNCGF